jgi:hypothetical protein
MQIENQNVLHSFSAKRWIDAGAMALFGFLGRGGLLTGLFLLVGLLKSLDGRPGTIPGIITTLFGLFFILIAARALFAFIARRESVLRITQEGIESTRVGESSLEGLEPGWIATMWSILSGEGFRVQRFLLPWRELEDVVISGLPSMKVLSIRGSAYQLDLWNQEPTPVHRRKFDFADAEFVRPLPDVYHAIAES